VREDEKIQKLIRFSKSFYCITQKSEKLFFNDLRFGQTVGWADKNADFVFMFGIEKTSDCRTKISRGQWRSSRLKGMGKLWERIKGN
jgi:inner membrane protein